MSDACCATDVKDPESGPERLWRVRELQMSAAAAALLAVAGVALLPVAPAASAEPVTTQISPLIVVMDVSGSMTTPADNDPARTRCRRSPDSSHSPLPAESG